MKEEEMLTQKDWLAIHELEDKIALNRYGCEFHNLPDREQKKVSKWAEESYFGHSKRTRKRKPTAFNKCVGKSLKAATYKNKKQWQGEFKKAVKRCKA